jgi:hypothetical protein
VDRQVNVQGNGAVKARAVGRPDEEVVKKSSLLLHTFFGGGRRSQAGPGRTDQVKIFLSSVDLANGHEADGESNGRLRSMFAVSLAPPAA